jgi:hypothetical protein
MAGGPAPVELSADCTTCGLETGVVEVYDTRVAACRFGLPASARCRLCGISHEGTFNRPAARPMHDVPANRCPACLEELGPRSLDDRRCAKCGALATLALVAPAASLDSEPALLAALDAWTAREQWTSRAALLEATFCDPDLGSLLLRIRRNEPLEVLADPFSGAAPTALQRISVPAPALTASDVTSTMTSAGQQPSASPLAPSRTSPLHPPVRYGTGVIALPAVPPPPPSAPPRAIVYPLVSVIAADGEIHPAERALVDRFLESEGLAPLTEHEFRVHHPTAVAHLVPKERREMVVQLMCETATADGIADESERRVIRAYAAAWEVPSEKVEFWMWGYENMSSSPLRTLWVKLRRFVLSARWSDAGQESR